MFEAYNQQRKMYYFAPERTVAGYKSPGGQVADSKGLCVSVKSMKMDVENTDSTFRGRILLQWS